MSDFLETIIYLGFFASVFFAYFFYIKFKNKERMSLIEKNADVTDIYKKREWKFPWFILGYTLLGAALGFFIGIILSIMNITENELQPMAAFALAILFGAVGIIVGNIIEKKQK